MQSTAGTAAGQAVRHPYKTVLAWAADRGISDQTLDKLPVAYVTEFFPELERKSDAIAFKYRHGWKGRAVPDKAFVASKGFKLGFWNIEAVLRSSASTVYIVEGEMDAAALVEAGIDQGMVLSVPNGSARVDGTPSENPMEVRGYAYVLDALKAGLAKKKRFVWCGDNDGPGRALRADMARILGAARFNYIEWPDGVKDANDFLVSDGGTALRELLTQGSLAWPVSGLFRLVELPDPPPLVPWSPGYPEWERKVQLAAGTLSVVTGHPGHGKSTLFNEIWYRVIKGYDLTMCQATYETLPKPDVRRQLRCLIYGKHERNLTQDELRRADEWINAHYLFVVHPEQRPTLEWILDMAEVAVIRHGAKIFQIDPWNRLEDSKGTNENETDYIRRCLRTLYTFAKDMNCHVQIVAHPAKMDSARRGTPPMLEDIAGSKNWDNMVDQGFTVHRPKVFDGKERKTEAVLYHRKARFEALGYPCKLNLNFDIEAGTYRSVDYEV